MKDVRKFIAAELVKAGFNPRYWRIKEEPVENIVWTIQNSSDTVEFTVGRDTAGNLFLAYDRSDGGYAAISTKAQSIQEAIEKTERI
jgi:hypothetical protein